MIWEWVWDDGDPCKCPHPYQWDDLPHYLQQEYVGHTTVQEIAEHVHKSWPGTVVAASPEEIQDLLFPGTVRAGYTALPSVRALIVTCKVDNYRVPRKCVRKSQYCEHTAADRTYTRQKDLETCFNHLLAVPNKVDFYLGVDFEQRNVRFAVLEEVLEAFKPVYLAFQEAGADLEVHWKYPGSIQRLARGICLQEYYDKSMSRSMDENNASLLGMGTLGGKHWSARNDQTRATTPHGYPSDTPSI
jgi:hypothetical protein